MTDLFLKIDGGWSTPATRYQLGKVGIAELLRRPYKRGVYVMEGVDGYPAFEVMKPIPVTELRLYGKTWMVDDPLHWIGMQRLGKAAQGSVLVVGLGLGLVVWALGANSKVSHVTVLEREPDVLNLIRPKLVGVNSGTDDRYWLEYIQGDFWSAKDYSGYDTIILDIWTSSERRQATGVMMQAALALLKERGHHGPVFVWGTRIQELNPAVKPMSEQAMRFLDGLGKAQRAGELRMTRHGVTVRGRAL